MATGTVEQQEKRCPPVGIVGSECVWEWVTWATFSNRRPPSQKKWICSWGLYSTGTSSSQPQFRRVSFYDRKTAKDNEDWMEYWFFHRGEHTLPEGEEEEEEWPCQWMGFYDNLHSSTRWIYSNSKWACEPPTTTTSSSRRPTRCGWSDREREDRRNVYLQMAIQCWWSLYVNACSCIKLCKPTTKAVQE